VENPTKCSICNVFESDPTRCRSCSLPESAHTRNDYICSRCTDKAIGDLREVKEQKYVCFCCAEQLIRDKVKAEDAESSVRVAMALDDKRTRAIETERDEIMDKLKQVTKELSKAKIAIDDLQRELKERLT